MGRVSGTWRTRGLRGAVKGAELVRKLAAWRVVEALALERKPLAVCAKVVGAEQLLRRRRRVRP